MDGSEHVHAHLPRARRSVPEAHGLRRDRLLRTLDEVMRTRLGLVIAPPGAGKTTLMAQWAATVGSDVAWLRVGREDGAEGRLATRLTGALTPHLDLDDGVSTTSRLAIAVERRADPLVLVLDGMHTVTGTSAEADLERLLLIAPAHFRVLVGSRTRLSINFAQCELPQAVLVAEDDLAFRVWEVERLFRTGYGVSLAAGDAAALARLTGGWAAGLRLFHLATAGGEPTAPRRAVAALARRSLYARTYLDTEVLGDLSRPLRRFLCRTSVLETLTPARCDALLGRATNSRRMLAEAAGQCPMVTGDVAGETFVVHEALRRHLETQLEEGVGSAQARAWWCRAADVLEASGSQVEAVRARAKGEDWTGVRRLMHAGGGDLLAAGASRWTDVLPAWSGQEDPWASLVVARQLLDDGRLVAASAAAERVALRLDDPVRVELCRAVTRAAAVWGPSPDLSAPQWVTMLRAATRREPLAVATQAESLPPPLRDLVRGVALLLAGDVRPGEQALVRCAHASRDGTTAGLAARLIVAVLGLLRDGPGSASHVLDLVVADADLSGRTWISRVALGLAAAFDTAWAVPGPQGADGVELAAAVVADCEQRGDPWGALLVRAASAVARLRSGDLETAGFERLVVRCRELDAGVLEAWVRSVHSVVAGLAEVPDAQVDARSAESYARFAAVPGAVCLAYAALAVTRPGHREELLDLAAVSGAATGLGPAPWPWLGPVGALLWQDDETAPAGAASGELVSRRVPRAEPAPVALSCFGAFTMKVDGEVLDLTVARPKARSVLRMLAVHGGRMVHREQLADALWSEVELSAALHNLQVNVSVLRGMLSARTAHGPRSLIVREGDAYGLALLAGSSCDVLDFNRALAEARTKAPIADAADAADAADRTARALRRALEAYAGDLLPEEGPADWAAVLREQYRARAAEAAASLAALELHRGDASAAVAAATRSVEIDACQDGAWRTLIGAYRLSGDLAAGERAHRRYADVLVDLGVSPERSPHLLAVDGSLTGARRPPPLRPPPGPRGPALGTRSR